MLLKINSVGQLSAVDFFFAMLIVVSIVVFVFSIYESNFAEIENVRVFEGLESKANGVIDALVLRPGIPSNWECRDLNSVRLFGLVYEPFVIDLNKMNRFDSVDYNSLKNGLGLHGNEFYFLLRRDSEVLFEIGSSSNPNSNYSVGVERVVDFNGSNALLQVMVFE